MSPFNLRSLLLAAVVLSNCITWTASRHHYAHNVSGHRSRHRRQGKGLYLSASYVIPGGEGAGWGEWGEVSPCSRTCGGGVASQKRICLQIGPDGQSQCTGGDTKFFSCQTQDCPAGSRDYRAEQCSEFDDVAFRDIKYKWVPYTKAPNPCELNCMPHGERFYYRHKTKVQDGTRCNDESFDVCVNGMCQPVGCDMMLGSTAREDKCRECRGNGANCHTTAGVLDTQDLRKGYNDMLLIPEGATTIIIAEIASSNNYLALRAKNGTYYLNGDYHIDFPRTLVIAGALWSYERSQQGFAAPDKLRCLGPTNEPLYLALLLQDVNVGIEYEYSVPNELAPPRNKRYNWVHEEFTPCSASCGGGFQTRNVTCRSQEELEIVDEGLCDSEMRPPINQTCNTEPCAAQWTLGPWGKCSKRCGKGGTSAREVHCTQVITMGYPSIVDDKTCFDLLGPKPELYQKCNENATCPVWFAGPWKPCDKLCDEGKQKRQVVCYQKNGRRIEVLGDEECEEEKPLDEQTCMLQPCDGVDWVLSEWSGCDSCLSTVRSRTVVCATKESKVVNDSFCAYHGTPKTQEPCDKTKLPPCDVQWYATQWSKCSVDCGKGLQTRKVFCGIFDGAAVLKVGDERCAGQPKYNDTKECEIPKEKCPAQWFAGPWTACTKKCGGGEQYRRAMCMRGGEPAECDGDSMPDLSQSCNTGPCDKDELLPVDESSPVVDDYEDCVEEDYPEVGLDADSTFKTTIDDFMLSDSPTEGSGMWTISTAEHESTFSESTLPSEEFLLTGTDITDTTTSISDLTDTDEDSTDTTIITSDYEDITDTGATNTTDDITSTPATGEEEMTTESGPTDETSAEASSESSPTESESSTLSTETSSTVSEPTGDTSETSDSGSSTSEGTTESLATFETTETESESTDTTDTENTSESGATETGTEDTGPTEPTETSETSSTETTETSESSSTESTETSETSSSETTETSESSSSESTETSETTETSESSSTETTETSETSSTETTETSETSSTETTETSETSSTETTETSETTDASETTDTGSTEATETTESGSTEATEVTETGSTEATETTETGSTEGTETTESGSTEPTETTETGSTEATETNETGSTEATETTETGSTEATETTETGSTEATETTESGSTKATEITESSSTEATETTESGTTEATETTETGSTEATETTETGSTEATETTESGTTEATETTESGTTEATETTESGTTEATETTETGSTEATETSETESTEPTETTETGSTELTETTESGSTETTELDTSSTSVTEETTTESGSTEGTESSSESSTTEASSTGLTRWDLSSTVEAYTTKRTRVCKPKSCVNSEFGCCPDKKTPALGPFDDGCLKPETCKKSFHGCCPDGLSPAQGPRNQGCPTEPCAETLFGCCESDNKTSAQGNDQEGCPPPPPACLASIYGCCKDGETEPTGPGKEGCPETTVTETEGTDVTTEETSTSSASTETVEGCAGSEYGCCFDNMTAATGPEQQGCPCSATQFGCCPDTVSPAQGPDYEGCVKSCNSSAYGCCPDNKTPAHGVDHEGCCLLYSFGCCPDNYRPADGPHFEGCGCQYSRFGCCPDNVTIATGPDNKGCGCQYTRHGCCPDNHSEASGPEFEGCMCHTYQFGCCPDGVTVARGPHGLGCYCQQSTFGCCGDEQTHAKGANKEGCDCASSKHGCCPDGSTEAIGPKFEGCTDKPEIKQAACNLKFERGPCRNYSVSWFYDTEYGGCSRFWYGGCEGNGNRFGSKEECEDTCVSPPPKDACKLPQIKGACLGYNVRWYYDNERETCTNFVYGGCLGNNNNFETQELCQKQCEPERAIDQCNLEIEQGSCSGNYPRWGFNKESRHCEQFIWGGCEGNTNRFSTEAACMLRCNPPGEPQPECSEPRDVGNCTDTEALWSFSQSENRCVPFYYTGCGGTGNKFLAREDCQEACPSAFVPELCTLPYSTGNCSDYREKWYFDTKDQRCRQFYYGGCGGNGNKFDTEQECMQRCALTPSTTTVVPSVELTAVTAAVPRPDDRDRSEFCFLEIDVGPCNQLETKWAYDHMKGGCTSFQYGGCGGNQNNFPTEEHCSYYCKPSQDICQLPMLAGPCDESVMRWFYDSSSDSCSQFTYGGCEGNENRFESREECEHRCKSGPAPTSSTPATTTTTAKVENRIGENLPSGCSISPELEPCTRDTVGEVWYYDTASSACTAHANIESGVQCRTTGVFYSQEACERSCGGFRNIDVCRYSLEPGPCNSYQRKYHYNVTSGRCEEFTYGGCLGGPNRFSSEQECQHICMPATDPCTLQPDPGNCLANLDMWYYNPSWNQCSQFTYGGCGGNENKFETRELCEGRCRKQPVTDLTTTTTGPLQTTRQPEPQDECRTPESLEPCGNNVTVFFYDEATRSCKVADFGGCRYYNSFRSEEECERRCGAFRGLDACRTHLDPGPCRASISKFYFDTASGSCKPYAYGGCQGGPNRFSTIEECQDICAAVGPAPACLVAVQVGEICGAVPERRWHYDVARADCIVFAYQGCGGNENNFLSYDECAGLCRVAPSDVDSRICDQYAEECTTLETTCVYGVRAAPASEGCERCFCEEAVNCDQQRRECDALKCSFGIERTTSEDGCEKCQCFEDPCIRSNCTSEERCVAASYRDPISQEVVYSAHCSPVNISNDVLSDCEAYIEECARISCPYGVQRTHTRGCERCACVREEQDCAPLRRECDQLKCTYGLTRAVGSDGCERCKCLEHPCAEKACPAGERCVATPFRDAITQETRYSSDCRMENKPGACPAGAGGSTEGACRDECRDDADCRGVSKCCARGCAQRCVAPAPPSAPPATTHDATPGPEIPQAPQASTETEPEVAAAEGGKATLRCIFHGNPPPRITWRFGEITIDSDVDRYRLLSDGALEIVSLYRNDTGVYICVASNELGTAQQEITLRVDDPVRVPAGIAGEENAAVTGELEQPIVLRCQAYGFPPPTIFWYRGFELVPFSNVIFEARGQELRIRRLMLDTLGEYQCQAYNGEGRAATWSVTVQAYQPYDNYIPGNTYLVTREQRVVAVTPRVQTTDTTTHTTPGREPEIKVAPYTVPVQTTLIPASTSVTVGAQLTLPCEVDGYPVPEVHWTKDNAALVTSDRMWITESRLTIPRAELADSGVYSCHASNAYSSHTSTVQITVKEMYIPAKCVDNPLFANCNLIVQSRFCVHKYYSKFCCKSCVEAGQLDPRDAEMQADEPFRKK